MALSAKQKSFINEYLIDFNATRAAQRAGYEGDENTLAVTGSRLLRNDKVAEAVKTRLSEKAMTADEVLNRLAEHARGDIGDFITVTPGGEAALDLTGGAATRLIKKVTQRRTFRRMKDTEVEEVVLSVELHDAQSALALIGKHHGLFKDVSEVKGEIDLNVDDATERLFGRIGQLAARIRTDDDAEGAGPNRAREETP